MIKKILSRSQIDHPTNHRINTIGKCQNKLTHFQKNCVVKSDTFSQKSLASRSQSLIASKSAKSAHLLQVLQPRQVRQVRQKVSTILNPLENGAYFLSHL